MDSSKDGYYDLMQNMITVRGFSSHDSMEEAKILSYPGLLPNLYCITKTGQVYSVINDSYISWAFKNNIPYVNLSCIKDGKWRLEPFYIKDLVACSYIANANSYLENCTSSLETFTFIVKYIKSCNTINYIIIILFIISINK